MSDGNVQRLVELSVYEFGLVGFEYGRVYVWCVSSLWSCVEISDEYRIYGL